VIAMQFLFEHGACRIGLSGRADEGARCTNSLVETVTKLGSVAVK
jgi:hypothetical protein